MKVILKDGRRYTLRFDRGEELIGSLANFCNENQMKAGYFSGFGAVSEVTLMHYDLDTKKYLEKTFTEKMEIANLTGNVSWFEGKSYIHPHGIFSDTEMRAWAGHVKKMIIAATCELFLIQLDGEISREHSEEIGLNLMR